MNATNDTSGGLLAGLFARPQSPQLNQLAGMNEARQWGEAVARDVARYRDKTIAWKDVDPGCVLYGPPGTGKTTFAKALAATCHLPLVVTSYAEWQSAEGGHLGTTMAAMKAAFADAIAKAPCILFIDELDSVPMRGTGGQNANYNTQVTNALLKEFDGLKNVDGVIVVGACNHPEMLDAALVRSGRMDRMIAVTLPSVEELESIITYHVTTDELRSLCDGDWLDPIPRIALMCSGMSGADVEKLVRNARSVARRAGRPLAQADFMEVLDSPTKRASFEVQIRTAVHEAGHALVGMRLDVSTDITASIVSAKGSSGRVNIKPASEPATRDSIENLITFILAGRAAETLALEHPSELSGGTSKDNDLAQATRLAFDALTKLGFSEQRGLVWQAGAHHEQALPMHGPLADEIKAMLDACYRRAQDIITANEDFLKDVADGLIEHRVLSHADILSLDKTGRVAGRAGNGRHRLPPMFATYAPAPVHEAVLPAQPAQPATGSPWDHADPVIQHDHSQGWEETKVVPLQRIKRYRSLDVPAGDGKSLPKAKTMLEKAANYRFLTYKDIEPPKAPWWKIGK